MLYKDITTEQQSNLISDLKTLFDDYESLSSEYRERMVEVYETFSTFKEPNTGSVLTRFKVNEAHQIVRKVVPRIIAKSPKMLVSPRTDAFYEWDALKTGENRAEIIKRNDEMSRAVQDYINSVFQQENFHERLKYWVINQVTYWNAFAQIVPKTKISRSKKKTIKGQEVTEKMVSFLPTIDVASWTEMFYDPRYKVLEDMPWVFRVKEGVRIQDLYFSSENYFNLEELEQIWSSNFTSSEDYKNVIYNVTGVTDVKLSSKIELNSLRVKEYYWVYSFTGSAKDERLYKITIVNDAVLIWLEEITEIPIVDIKCHEDPEVFFSVWYVEPIMGLQNEINFQKNAQATAISQALNRSWLYSPESGVDPTDLVDRPWNIIVCNKWVENAQRNLVEMQPRPLPSQYFWNINDYNRDIQRLSHTIDVWAPVGQQWWGTRTATAEKIRYFESNSVTAEVRKSFERWVVELAYKILDWTVNNIKKNFVIKRIEDNKFIEINIEALKDALERYEIRAEANSSSFDDLESRREEAIALKNLLWEAKQLGVPVNIEDWYRAIFNTFENIETSKILPEQDDTKALLEWLFAQWTAGIWNIPANTGTRNQPSEAWELTQQVAGWQIIE